MIITNTYIPFFFSIFLLLWSFPLCYALLFSIFWYFLLTCLYAFSAQATKTSPYTRVTKFVATTKKIMYEFAFIPPFSFFLSFSFSSSFFLSFFLSFFPLLCCFSLLLCFCILCFWKWKCLCFCVFCFIGIEITLFLRILFSWNDLTYNGARVAAGTSRECRASRSLARRSSTSTAAGTSSVCFFLLLLLAPFYYFIILLWLWLLFGFHCCSWNPFIRVWFRMI